jgi:hypothetical protein
VKDIIQEVIKSQKQVYALLEDLQAVVKEHNAKHEKLCERHIQLLDNCSCPDHNESAKKSFELLSSFDKEKSERGSL